MKYTANFQLNKPEDTDYFDIEDFNANADAIDAELQRQKNIDTGQSEKIKELQNPTYTVAESRKNIVSGEKIGVIFGKIARFFSDLKTVAFSGSYEDLSNKPQSLPANGGNAATVNGHTVNSDVPSGAKFTDTNTWRGIQNNLTSDSTADSLSAAQGKVLKGLVDGKANSSHAHAYIPLNTSGGIASCGGDGKYTYFKAATIKITANYINRPVVFELSGRGKCLSQVTVMFESVNNTDPALSLFRSNYENAFWIKKTATSTWEIYGQYNETYGSYALHRITGTGADIGVTVNMVNISSLPSGCTQVSYGGNANYANSAGSVAWGNVTGRPSSLPANGGNANTVNNHTVNADVPSGAKFTDTNTWRPQPDWNATSGDSAIKNKPTIPSVGNGTVTITQNGTTKGTFTMNQSGNTTIALTDNNTTYGTATSSASGLMSSGDKSKLDGIASGANKTNVANNLTTNVAGYALDARQGKALKDSVDALNGSLLLAFESGREITDTLDLQNQAGWHTTGPAVRNVPTTSYYGFLLIIDGNNKRWRLLIFISTSLDAIYLNFYNKDVTPAAWSGWKKIN